ncbi:diguanylate cyclase [Candidatus Chloroploca sp. Khr17]|uniref:diguanylate cyclase n=1 Tax=Candidatus Chloroploca sp. Khr17 TaxID=2496869 RepID=UPI00101D4C30|nr:diguanylate cyclase [Candidatus Chloroploca sp. Khr17]
MNGKLCLRVCRHYYEDVAQAVRELGYPFVTVEAYALTCGRPQLLQHTDQIFARPVASSRTDLIVLGACAATPDALPAKLDAQTQLIHLSHCLVMLAGPELIDTETKHGTYLLSPGWLRAWRAHLYAWGFDQMLARDYFHEAVEELLLLDTETDPEALSRLEEFAAYLALPYRVRTIGLDYLKLYLAKIILEWYLKTSQTETKSVLQDAKRKIAEYAMAFDLLVDLSQIRSEETTITAIRHMFAMLFGCNNLEYAQIQGHQIVAVFAKDGHDQPARHGELAPVLASMEGDHALIPQEEGFYLRIRYHDETFGLVVVRHITFPEYRNQYLNLGLAIANQCGLALANARTYSMLREAESSLRSERDLTEELRQMMAHLNSNVDMDAMLHQVLVQLDKIVPNHQSLLFLLEENTLRLVSAHPVEWTARLTGKEFSSEQPPFAEIMQRRMPLILDAAAMASLELPLVTGFKSWMGLPLLYQEHLLGLLTLGSKQEETYTPSQVAMMQVLANEVATALENGRLFREVYMLAGTDPLTRLYNRRRFSELAETEFRRVQRYGGKLSAIFMDIDHFKRVNDVFSHAVGDQVLEHVAKALKQVRPLDIVARYGGEEFIIVCLETGLSEAMQVAERLRQIIERMPVETLSGPVQITMSFGVATLEPDLTTLGELIWRADQALYYAKYTGRNRVSTWKEAETH